MLQRLRARPEWKFLAILPRANPFLAAVWWSALVVRSLLPALLAVAMGLLVGTVEAGGDLVWPLAGVGTVFVLRKRRASMSSTEPASTRGRHAGGAALDAARSLRQRLAEEEEAGLDVLD